MSTRSFLIGGVRLVLLTLVLIVLTACAVGDDYRRPATEKPAAYRGAAAAEPSLGARDWREVFTDSTQQVLIEAALAGNLDLQSAEARVREAQAAVTIARSGLLPSLGIGLSTSPTARRPGENFSSSFVAAGLLSWEIDLWGRIRRGAEAARADLVAREAARDGARVSLIAETANRYHELTALRAVLASTESSARLQADSLRLMRRRNQAGIVSAAEVRQAEGQLASTEARLPELRRQVAATENALSFLLGRVPDAVATASSAVIIVPVTDAMAPALPAGLPSELIERRPDLREAEQRLVAANARVGEAKALMLPSLSLTGTFGRIGFALEDLFSSGGSSVVASLGSNVAQTLYAGGALAANRDVAVARLDQALLNYRRTGLNALREVADALKAHDEAGAQLERQGARVAAQREALRLADKRFGAGVVSFMEVLDAQRQLLAAETDFVNTRLARQLAYVQAYRALGGGWTLPATVASESRM
jgi:multidrug efflux system outer membrane protein